MTYFTSFCRSLLASYSRRSRPSPPLVFQFFFFMFYTESLFLIEVSGRNSGALPSAVCPFLSYKSFVPGLPPLFFDLPDEIPIPRSAWHCALPPLCLRSRPIKERWFFFPRQKVPGRYTSIAIHCGLSPSLPTQTLVSAVLPSPEPFFFPLRSHLFSFLLLLFVLIPFR